VIADLVKAEEKATNIRCLFLFLGL